MAVLCLFLLLFVFMFLGVPVAISLGLSGAVSILMFSQDSVSSLAIKLFETSDAYTFLAIPFFLLSGAFMTTGGVAQRLIDFANACVGHIRGGLAIVLILAPIFFPIAMKLGIDPIHLGIVMVVNMEIGLVHPPVGLNLFVTSAVTGLTLGQTIRAAMPWLMILLVFLIMVTYLPFISLALPHWLGM
ncbi:TRAP transporter large permease subunit [Pseudomonas sp.]|uniref:TRAP transporter large permease subunit n=1 Tax=Pseudomonas sp. TaxID=306 RepID=UPI00258BC729|nr:TRAP transporter large permease subunit [Pseudomonas sp.]